MVIRWLLPPAIMVRTRFPGAQHLRAEAVPCVGCRCKTTGLKQEWKRRRKREKKVPGTRMGRGLR